MRSHDLITVEMSFLSSGMESHRIRASEPLLNATTDYLRLLRNLCAGCPDNQNVVISNAIFEKVGGGEWKMHFELIKTN